MSRIFTADQVNIAMGVLNMGSSISDSVRTAAEAVIEDFLQRPSTIQVI